MKRRDFLKSAGATALAVPALAQRTEAVPAQPPERPNFIFLFADDQGWGDLGCYGHPVLKTPAVDDLAKRGCRFTDFSSASPVCAPSRAAAMTGRNPNRYGMKFLCNDGQFDSPLYHHVPVQEPMLPRQLQKAGYRTGHIGKWHLSLCKYDDEPTPHDYGFDHYLILEKSSEGKWGRGLYRNPSDWSRNGERVPGKLADWTPTLYVDEAIRFIESCGDQPFYLNLWSFTPHEDVECDDRYKAMYGDRTAPEQTYFGSITQMDEQYGRLIAFLEERGLMDNTVIVYSSDNGPEHPLLPWGKNSRGSTGPFRGAKHVLYEGGVRVPGVIYWPGVAEPGSVSDVPVSLLDLLPTICGAAGAPMPEGFALDGGDFRPAFEGRPVERAHPLFWQYERAVEHRNRGDLFISPPVALRKGPWKLLCDMDLETGIELYNLEIDRGEKWNFAPQHPEIVEELRAELRPVFEDVNGPYSRETSNYLNPNIPDVRKSAG